MATQKQKYLGCVAGFWLAVIGLILIARHVWMDWVPESVMVKLSSADKTEVRQLLGEPVKIHSGTDYENWIYHRPDRIAEFQVYFTTEGKVENWSYDR